MEKKDSDSSKRPLLAPTTKVGRKRKSPEEKAETKRKCEQRRTQSRVNIGSSIHRWRKLQEDLGLKTDADTADFLLNSYEKYSKRPLSSTPVKTDRNIRPPPPPSLSSNGSESQSPTSMSSASLCYAEGCANGDNLLQQWSMNKCDVHGCFLGLDSCTCDPPFRLFPFPTQKQDPERRRQRWIQAFKRPDPRNPKKLLPPRPCHRVCSAHFVDGAPSEANPNPTLNLRPSSPVRDDDWSQLWRLKRRRIDGPNPAPAPLPTEIVVPSAVFYTLSVIIGVLLSLWRKAVREKDGSRMENCKLKAEVNQLRSQVSKLKELTNGLETNRAAESKEKSTALPEPLTSGNESSQRKEIQNWSIIGVQPHKTGPAPSQSQALEMMTQQQAKSQAQPAVQTATHPVMNGCQVYWIYQPVVQSMLVSTQQASINNQVASISNSSTQQPSTIYQMASISNSSSQQPSAIYQMASISNSSTQQPSTINQMASILNSSTQQPSAINQTASILNSSTQQPSTINQMASILNSSTQQPSTNNRVDSNYNSPSSGENVETEQLMVSLKCEDTEEETERKAESLLSREQENVLNSIKKEEKEGDWEESSVKMESDIRVRAEDVCLKKEEEG
ncbi:hypothetical protein GJAV_G00224100 [Gymnothorax javanicus]|nr:hypothetical protein GJAV_G00224100 [Gymnothorax javanicus]